MKRCPFCAEEIQDEAIRCKHCKASLQNLPWPGKKLYRSQTDRKLAGIAAGMGEYFNCDPTLMRIAWVVAAFLSGGLAVLAYLVLIFVIPNEDQITHQVGRTAQQV